MIAHFDDFCLWVYVLVDDMCEVLEEHLRRPGPEPACSDSELIAICLIGECRGWDVETELLSHMQAHRDKFPILPEQSRFNRRRRQLMWIINELRRKTLAHMVRSQDEQCVLDSMPIPVVQFHLARGDWPVHGANFGKISSKKAMIFGLHLLITWPHPRFRVGSCQLGYRSRTSWKNTATASSSATRPTSVQRSLTNFGNTIASACSPSRDATRSNRFLNLPVASTIRSVKLSKR